MTALAITITPEGLAAAVNAANTGTGPLVITQVALLSAPSTEIKRLITIGGEAIADNIIHVTITDETADTYSLTGLRLITDAGVVFATYHQASPILEKGAQQLVLLSADIVLTSVPAGSVTIGGTGFAYPPATETRQGVIEIATAAEVQAGTDTTRTLTPAGLQAAAATTAPAMAGTAAAGTAKHWARADHVHPSDTSKASKAGDTFTGNVAIQRGASEAGLTLYGGSKPGVSMVSNTTLWGLWSSEGGYLVQYDRATGKRYLAGIDSAKLVQDNGSTYGISISGDAATVGSKSADYLRAWGNLTGKPAGADLDFTFATVTGSPQYVWGSNDAAAGNSRIYATGNLSVKNADTVDGYHADQLLDWQYQTGKPNTVAGYGITDMAAQHVAHADTATTAGYAPVSTAQVLAAVAGATAGAVGTYVFGTIASTSVVIGATYSGSAIIPSGVYATGVLPLDSAASGTQSALVTGSAYLSGTWMAMGTLAHQGTSTHSRATLFLRIA